MDNARKWLLGGLALLVAGAVWALLAVHKEESAFQADGSFATLAGFGVLALALERLCEAVLAPWWGTASTKTLKEAAKAAQGTNAALAPAHMALLKSQRRLGASDATVIRTAAAAAVAKAGSDDPSKEEAKKTEEAANSAWVEATRERPTLLLPAAAIATVLCAYLHLFLLHGVASGGVPSSALAYAADAVVSGLAVAGGAKPFHDLAESIAASSTAKKAGAAEAKASSSS
jgi:amino acid transporter